MNGRSKWLNALPQPGLLPRGEGESNAAFLKIPAAGFARASIAKLKVHRAIPSPGGEGQDEGERKNHLPFFIRDSILVAMTEIRRARQLRKEIGRASCRE